VRHEEDYSQEEEILLRFSLSHKSSEALLWLSMPAEDGEDEDGEDSDGEDADGKDRDGEDEDGEDDEDEDGEDEVGEVEG